jgi:hypothetical protein
LRSDLREYWKQNKNFEKVIEYWCDRINVYKNVDKTL